MSSPLNDVLAGFSRKYRKKAKQVEPLIQKYLDEGMAPAQAVDKALKETDFKAYMTKAVKDAMLSSAVIGAGSYTAGKSTPLDEAWDPSGMTLSEKLHGTSKAMRNHILNTIKEQLKQGAHAMKSARALYDGYNTTDNVVRKQRLPKYLQDVVNFSRRSDLGKNDVIALQKLVRKARRMVDRLAQNGAPNRALKTSYKELLDAVESCSDKALKRAIRTAVEEKSRYVAERIARTESARAWYQGFLKDTMDDSDVVAYRWVESTRHPTEDICDEYAKVDAYGLGPGIFPKDKAPELPAHPHCLCHYEKVYASELERIRGLASGKIEYSDNHVTVVREPNIAYNDDEGIKKLFNKFCDDYKDKDIEHALVVTMDGEVYHCIGSSGAVDITVLGPKLQGAKVIHNHPDDGDVYGDCFSCSDFTTFFRCKIKRLEVTSGLGRFSIEYYGEPITETQAYWLYKQGYRHVLVESIKSGNVVDYEQRAIMRYLRDSVPSLKYVEEKNDL